MTKSPLDATIELWLGELARRGLAEGTRDLYRRTLYAFADMYEHDRFWLAEYTVDDCRRFLDQWQHLKPSTLGIRISALNGFWSFCEEEGKVDTSPTRRIKRPRDLRSEDKDVLSVSTGEVERLFAACDNFQELLCVATLAYCGPRKTAAAKVRRRDVDLARKTIRFLEKGGKVALKRMPDEYAAIIRAGDDLCIWASPDDYLIPSVREPRKAERNVEVIYNTVKRIAARCGISTHVHALRAAFAVHYLETHPGDLEALQELMGHARTDTTRIYLRRFDKLRSMERVADLSWAPMFPSTADAQAAADELLPSPAGLPEPLRTKLAALRGQAMRARGRR